MNLKEFNFDMPSVLYRGTMPYEIKRNPKLIEDLKAKHIANIILLCDDKECQSATSIDLKTFYIEQGFIVLQYAIPDFQAPDAENLRVLVETIHNLLKINDKDHNTLIHCKGGKGRTGMVIACLARKIFNFSSDQAVAWVRKTVPEAVETKVQHDAIKMFATASLLGPPPAYPPPPIPLEEKQNEILKDAPLAPRPNYTAPPPPLKEKEETQKEAHQDSEFNHFKRSAASLSDSSSDSSSDILLDSDIAEREYFDAPEHIDKNKDSEETK